MNEPKLPTHRPVTLREVRPMNIYDVVPPEGRRAGIEAARAPAVMNRLIRDDDAVVQGIDDLIEAEKERQRERRRRGR